MATPLSRSGIGVIFSHVVDRGLLSYPPLSVVGATFLEEEDRDAGRHPRELHS